MQLLEHFKELTLHPKNAEELKGLILQLAVQGKLTKKWRTENPDVEPALVLLERINEEKERLIKEKKIKKEKPIPEISINEIPYGIPKNWKWTKIGSISQIVGGGTPKSDNPHFFTEIGIPWFTPADLGKGKTKYVTRGRRDLTLEGLQNSSAQLMPAGSVLFSSRAPIGHTAICLNDFCTNQGFKSAVPYLVEMNEFIYLYLISIVEEVNRNASGTTFKEVSGAIVKNFPIPLVPLEEQKAIVEVVHQLFAEVEQLETLTKERIQLKADFATSASNKLTQAAEENTASQWAFLQEHFGTFFTEKENIKKLREGILQLAVQGKLTRDWRALRQAQGTLIEHASTLLEKIKAEKENLIKEAKIKKEKPLPEISKDEIPYELPEGWIWCRLGTITDIIAGASFKSGDFNESGGAKCIKITNAGVREFVETNDFLPEDFINKYPNFLVKTGDLILALTRPYIKDGLKISTCPESYNNSLLNQRVAAIRAMTKELHHSYVFTFLQSPHILNFYKFKYDEKSQQPNMKMADITDLLFALPPIEEQKAIVEKVNSLMALCDKLEKEIETNQTTQEEWMQSCLKEVVKN